MKFVFIMAIMLLGITTAQGQQQGQTVLSQSTTTTGSASGTTGATGSASGSSQTPLLLPGEIPDTSTQAASTTAAASSSASSVCPPPVPSTDGGSANLTEIAGGASLGAC
jgi:hypothetical protein